MAFQYGDLYYKSGDGLLSWANDSADYSSMLAASRRFDQQELHRQQLAEQEADEKKANGKLNGVPPVRSPASQKQEKTAPNAPKPAAAAATTETATTFKKTETNELKSSGNQVKIVKICQESIKTLDEFLDLIEVSELSAEQKQFYKQQMNLEIQKLTNRIKHTFKEFESKFQEKEKDKTSQEDKKPIVLTKIDLPSLEILSMNDKKQIIYIDNYLDNLSNNPINEQKALQEKNQEKAKDQEKEKVQAKDQEKEKEKEQTKENEKEKDDKKTSLNKKESKDLSLVQDQKVFNLKETEKTSFKKDDQCKRLVKNDEATKIEGKELTELQKNRLDNFFELKPTEDLALRVFVNLTEKAIDYLCSEYKHRNRPFTNDVSDALCLVLTTRIVITCKELKKQENQKKTQKENQKEKSQEEKNKDQLIIDRLMNRLTTWINYNPDKQSVQSVINLLPEEIVDEVAKTLTNNDPVYAEIRSALSDRIAHFISADPDLTF